MTELQTGLIGLGAAAVIGVAAYNKWQEYRHRKLAEQVLQSHHADVLLDAPQAGGAGDLSSGVGEDRLEADEETTIHAASTTVNSPAIDESRGGHALRGERIEPVMHPDPEPQEEEASPIRHEPTVAPGEGMATQRAEPGTLPVPARRPDEPKEARNDAEPVDLLSPLIDYLASFETVEPAAASQILEAQRDALARIRKPVHWVGYNELSREWEPIVEDNEGEYRRFRVGLQLVDRQGPLDESDLSVFHIAMQDLATDLMAIVELPTRQPALDTAAKLDEFCVSVDIQIGINVISQERPFPGTKLRALAEAAGMVIDGDGCFVRRDDEGNVLFTLHNQEAQGFSAELMKSMSTHGITFLLDVPRVSHGERVFNQMVDLARRFSDVLRGSLVDDNRQPLSEGGLEPIRRQVGQYQSVMAGQGLPAGGPLTRRLFS